MIYVGDRVKVTAQWSSFHGLTGVVTQTRPHIMMLIDDDRLPIRVIEREVTRLAEPFRSPEQACSRT